MRNEVNINIYKHIHELSIKLVLDNIDLDRIVDEFFNIDCGFFGV